MNYEQGRLSTFSNWPSNAEVDPVRIAKAGFYFTGQGLEVQCFRCGGKISEWNYGDQVMARHRRLDPLCPFVVDPASSGNVPLLCAEQSQGPQSSAQGSSRVAGPLRENIPSSLTLEDEIYQNHALRLLSFINWPISFISRESLVLAGFYHAGGGIVRCAYCGGELRGGWRAGDVPLSEHRRHFPECSFARAAGSAGDMQPGHAPPTTTTQAHDKTSQIDAMTHNEAILLAGGGELRSLGVLTHGATSGARHRKYATMDARLATYRNWPTTLKQAPHSLAEAGFYYTDVDDQVRCFYCDGGLGRWEPEDDPWTEHARWFQSCAYVLLLKGKDFVDRSRSRRGRENPTNANVTFKPIPGILLSSNPGVRPSRSHYQVTADTLERAMDDACARAALSTGLQPERVRQAIRRKMQLTGLSFMSADALIDATLHEQLNEGWNSPPAPTQCPYGPADITGPPENSEYSEIDDEESNATPTQRNPPTNQMSVTEDPPNIIDNEFPPPAQQTFDTMPMSSTAAAVAMVCSSIAVGAPSNLMAVDDIHEYSSLVSDGASSHIVLSSPNEIPRSSNEVSSSSIGVAGSSNGVAGSSDGVTGSSSGAVRSSNGVASSSNGVASSSNGVAGSSNGVSGCSNGVTGSSNRVAGSFDGVSGSSNGNPGGINEIPRNSDEASQEMKEKSIEETSSETADLPLAVQSVNLEEENRQLKEARLCKVCMDNEVCVVFLPCGHLVSCASCSAGLPHCPLCRGAVRALVRAYLS